MNASGCSRIPSELCYWITFLTKALPLRSIGTFIKLMIGSMLSVTGFVTEAYSVVDMQNEWLQDGKWSWLSMARQFVRLCLMVIKTDGFIWR